MIGVKRQFVLVSIVVNKELVSKALIYTIIGREIIVVVVLEEQWAVDLSFNKRLEQIFVPTIVVLAVASTMEQPIAY